MEYLVVFLITTLVLVIGGILILFCYFFVKNLRTISTIKKDVRNITIEYNVFLLRKNYARSNRLSYNEPFSITYKTNSANVKTSKITQATCFSALIKKEKELDEMLSDLPEPLRTLPSIKECIVTFDKVKQGISEANPYTQLKRWD